ncbi:2615_t:CDS:2, partial [Acaulospora colombiana]
MNNWFSQQPKEQRIVSSSIAESSRSVQKRINGAHEANEDRITSPSGREVATPFRQVGNLLKRTESFSSETSFRVMDQAYMGRGGAGNGIAEHSRGFRHRAAKQYW